MAQFVWVLKPKLVSEYGGRMHLLVFVEAMQVAAAQVLLIAWKDVLASDITYKIEEPCAMSDNEPDIQLEIRYTAGEDEYGTGRPFDPTRKEQEHLIKLLKERMSLSKVASRFSLSIWTIPHYKGVYSAAK